MWYVTFRIGGAVDVTRMGDTLEFNRKAATTGKVEGLLVLDEASSLQEARVLAKEWKRRIRGE